MSRLAPGDAVAVGEEKYLASSSQLRGFTAISERYRRMMLSTGYRYFTDGYLTAGTALVDNYMGTGSWRFGLSSPKARRASDQGRHRDLEAVENLHPYLERLGRVLRSRRVITVKRWWEASALRT